MDIISKNCTFRDIMSGWGPGAIAVLVGFLELLWMKSAP